MVLKLRIYSQGNFVFDSTNVQINALNINTKESEFGPFKVDNKLYYTSSRERKIGIINLDRTTQHQMLDLYLGELKDSVTVTKQKPLRNKINNSFNQGSAYFDKSTSKLYYAGNVPSDWKGDRYKLAIFSTELKNGKFLKPKVELLLPDTFSVSHPMIYNNTLYFSSNLKGGKGKADLYKAELVNGKWTNIKNLEQLNSAYDDYFPFATGEHEIYFSSNRPGGFGGQDLYKYSNGDGTGKIENLGKPINSKYDDYGIYVEPGQDKGYFTTNRNENQDDIYHFKKTWPSFNNCVAAIREKYCYDLSDEKSLDTDSLKGYFYEWDFGDGSKQKGITATHCYLEPGDYVINLNIVDISTKAVFLNQTSLDLKVDSIVHLKINALDTMLVNKKFTVSTLGTYLPDKKITGYYFEVDDKRLRTESFEYSFPKTGKYRIKLGVEYEDLILKTKGMMCTTLDVTCVDSAAWLPFEQKQLDAVIAKFQARNLRSGPSGMENMDYDAELAFNAKLGLSREKLAEKIDNYLSSENILTASGRDNSGKNLGNNKDGLSGMDEDAELAYRKKQQQEKADGFNSKNLGNNKDGLSGMDEDAELAYKKKQQQEKADGYNSKNLGNNKDGLSGMDEDADLNVRYSTNSFTKKNLRGRIDTLLNMNEEAGITFRVHLGKSKTQRDTGSLHSKGIYGIKEEFINNEYYYTYGNESRVNKIEKYYQKILKAGIKEPIIIGYNNNVIIPNQSSHLKIADLNDEKKQDKPLTVKEKINRLFKKSRPKQKEAPAAAPLVKDSIVAMTTPAKAESQEVAQVSNALPPINKTPKKEESFIYPVALKPDEVKIEDAHVLEGETARVSKLNLEEFVAKYGDSSAPDLQFRVQISAFKFRNRYEFPHLENLGTIENTLTEGGITRITIGGQFDTYRKAQDHTKKVIAAGQKDAFVTAFYKGKRVYVENLEKMGIFVTK